MTCATPRPWMWRRCCMAWERGSPCTTRLHWPTRGGHTRDLGYAESMAEAAQDAQVVLLLTEWPEFTGLRPERLGSLVARRNIVDGRNALDPAVWSSAGWNYRALGLAGDTVKALSRETEQARVGISGP